MRLVETVWPLCTTEWRPDTKSTWRRGTVLTVPEINAINARSGFYRVRKEAGK